MTMLASAIRARGSRSPRPAASSRSGGATSSTPVRSPSHQTRQNSQRLSAEATPSIHSTVVPIVALIAVLAAAPRSARATTSRILPRRGSKLARESMYPALTAARALPQAIPAATAAVLSPVALAKKAPTAIAGQTRGPNTTTEASATPLGGQTAETMSLPAEKVRPSLATAK